MDKQQLKNWTRIIITVVILAFAGILVAGIISTSGFVADYFTKPFLFFVPLIFLTIVGMLYIIYMFIKKGEVLRIIANILLCVLAIYLVFNFATLRYSELLNQYRYNGLNNVSLQIVNNIFEDSTVEQEKSSLQPIHYSMGEMMVYESTFDRYTVNTDDRISCYVNTYCVNNYFLGYDKLVRNLEDKYLNNLSENNYRNTTIKTEDAGSGESDGLQYKWTYEESEDEQYGRYHTEFAALITYENSACLVVVSLSHDKPISVDVETETEKIVTLIKSMDIFVNQNRIKTKPTA